MNGVTDTIRPAQPVNRLLWIAAAAGAEAAVRLHIDRGDYLEWRDKRGLTPLMVAAARNRSGVCRLLLEAGVDAGAIDETGRDALALARAAGATNAADEIAAWIAQSTDARLGGTSCGDLARAFAIAPSEPSPLESMSILSVRDEASTPQLSETPTISVERELSSGLEPAGVATIVLEFAAEGPEERLEAIFGDWESVTMTDAPPDRPELATREASRQRRINQHTPVDKSAVWDDFDADLPELSRPLPRADDADFQSKLRRIMLLALREGSVPGVSIEALLSERVDVDMRDEATERHLHFALGELGAGVDERLEHDVGDQTFRVFVDPAESEAEEREIDEAMAFFEDLRSGRNDPLRLYLRSIGSGALLGAEREVAIAKAMEAATERAVQALATWPPGLCRLLESVAGAESNPAVLVAIIDTRREALDAELDSVEADNSAARPVAGVLPIQDDDQPDRESEPESAGTVAAAVDTLAAIRELDGAPRDDPDRAARIRDLLCKLTFRPGFLSRLADTFPQDHCASAEQFRCAVSELIARRDEMTLANVRLVYSTAKRYVHTGVPLDDLIQEGNVGLLKAVDRFDWRRGFRFSTMAIWWIRQQISRYAAESAFDIRTPIHVHERISRLQSQIGELERSTGRCPGSAEQAQILGLPIAKLEMYTRPSSDPLSIEQAANLRLVDMTWQGGDPMSVLADKEVADLLSETISTLNRKSEAIVRMRTGIGVNEQLTLEQVGAAFELTRERIRQIEAKAMRRLSSTGMREMLARATGRELSKRDSITPADAEDDSGGPSPENVDPDDIAPRLVETRRRLQEAIHHGSYASEGQSIQFEMLPEDLRRLLDSARTMGIEVQLETGNDGVRIFVDEVPQRDRYSRKLVRELLQRGFVREPGKGYRL